MHYINRIKHLVLDSCFLFGPRGTGKSTWLRENYPNAVLIDLLDNELYRTFSSYPERIEEYIKLHVSDKKSNIIIIDEIQRIPELLAIVHKLIEENKNFTFILTGSSARKLKKHNVDLLGGRASLSWMHPYMACELGDDFNLEKALTIGMVPLVWSAKEPAKKLAGYIGLYLEQEVKFESIIRNVSNFSRFLEALSFSHSHVINASSIARECEVKRSTVSNYLDIVEDLLIFKRIPVFNKRAKRTTVSHSKAYFFDCGVFRHVRPKGLLDSPEDLTGQVLEGLVYQHLNAWIDNSESDVRLYFWRTHTGSEVDFVLYGQDCFCAIEVKKSATVRMKELKPLRQFKEEYAEAKVLFLYGGNTEQIHHSIPCIPIDKFLRNLYPDTRLPFTEY